MKTDEKPALRPPTAILDDFQKRTGELYAVFAPLWNARADTLKTIISLSSASIVLSVTFSSSLRQLNVGSAWRYLIVASFVLLTVALVTAFVALWWGTRVYRLQSRMIDQRIRMNKVLHESTSADEVEKALQGIVTEVLQPIYRTDFAISALYTIAGFCFCVAILSLAIVGVARLL